MNTCNFTLKRGKRKNEKCNKKCKEIYCKYHSKNTPVLKKIVPKIKSIVESTNSNFDTIESLRIKLSTIDTTRQNVINITKRMKYLELIPIASTEYQKNLNWLRHALNFPYNKIKNIPISIETPLEETSNYVSSIYKKLDDYIYGMKTIKEELISFVCKRISNPESKNHVLSLQGDNGVGKTRLAHGLAEALDLPIRTINLGCVSDVSYFTGYNFTYVDSEPGRIVQILNETKYKNCIIYFDELDKIHETSKGQSINSFLTHLIDYSQNKKYQDLYLSGLELDLSNVFFVFSFNDDKLLDKTVKDRLKIIKIPPHSFDDQVEITRQFVIPDILSNLKFNVDINIDIIKDVVKRNQTHQGLRNIYRIFDDVVCKLNVLRMLNTTEQKKLTFYDPDYTKCIENIINASTINDHPDVFPSFYI